MGRRVIAQRVLTGEFLDWDVPLNAGASPRRDLSGPGSLSGSVEPEYARLIGPDGLPVLDEWSTAVYVEVDGVIRWGGLVVHVVFDGGKLNIDCAGFTAYAAGLPYTGILRAGVSTGQPDPYAGRDKDHDGFVDGVNPPMPVPPPPPNIVSPSLDAADAIRAIWDDIQTQPDGDLGLVVDAGKSGYLLGNPDGTDPYELVWWEAPDCGSEIDQIARQAPLDYVEEHAWSVDRPGTIEHRLRWGYPRLGRRRDDLRFAQGENIIAATQPQRMGEDFANEVLALGKGEGALMLTKRVTNRDKRLRRCYVYADKLIGSTDRLDAVARGELADRAQATHIPMIQVRDHPNAPVGSWQLGDDILVDVNVPWIGRLAQWHRVVSDEVSGDGSTATLTLVRVEGEDT